MGSKLETWQVGEYTFWAEKWHDGSILYTFQIGDRPRSLTEFYPTLDKAMVAAVGEKHTGHRGAGGTGVGTAADWFMKMIGAER